MADSLLANLTALTGATTASGDLLFISDISDTTLDATGTAKKITAGELLIGLASISSGLTIGPLTLASGTITASQPVLNLSQTWNAAGVTFTGAKINITDTASAAASLLVDFQVGGTSIFSVDKTGSVVAGGIFVGNDTTSGVVGRKYGGLWKTIIQDYSNIGAGSGLTLLSTHSVHWSNDASNSLAGTADVALYRDAAAALAQRNGTNAQTLRVYRTFTDASNYQRIELGWNTSTALLMNTGAGTGADGNIAFNDAALATTATKGYVMIPSCAGAPTGVPADIPTGQVALHFDSTNNKLYVYDGAWLSTAALT